MEWTQTLVILGTFGGGFVYLANRIHKIDERVNDIERRLTIIETILSMMGAPVKMKSEK